MDKKKRLFLIDAYALIFRGYYAFIKNPRINSKGVDTSAILGFTNSLFDVIKRENPDYLAVCFDKGGSQDRIKIFDQYKANRDETPEAIKIAVPIIENILKSLNISILVKEGYEADDVIGTIAKKVKSKQFDTYMVTPDKDFAQLVDESIFMYRPVFGGGYETWGITEVLEKFEVSNTSQVIDFLAMKGDSVDNIPGLPGVGDKTAKKFIKQFGSIEELLKNTSELKGKLKEKIENIDADNISSEDISSIRQTIDALDNGKIRVAEQVNGDWLVNEWVKKSILYYFTIENLKVISSGDVTYFDKLEPKKNYEDLKIRVVPPGVVRYGAFCEPGVVVMPGFVNIGAYVGSGTMVDTWATVGSCAQIGKNVHLSGGVGIGGVLEPPSAMPVIIEDGAFIGSRAIIVEGVRVGKGAVIGANVTITSSTPVIDVSGKEAIEHKGVVPENSVVIPGTRPKKFPSGEFEVQCALIIGQRKESTNEKTSLNDALRTFGVDV